MHATCGGNIDMQKIKTRSSGRSPGVQGDGGIYRERFWDSRLANAGKATRTKPRGIWGEYNESLFIVYSVYVLTCRGIYSQ